MRTFHIQKINEFKKKEEEEIEKAKKGGSVEAPKGPAISPSSVYNFKK